MIVEHNLKSQVKNGPAFYAKVAISINESKHEGLKVSYKNYEHNHETKYLAISRAAIEYAYNEVAHELNYKSMQVEILDIHVMVVDSSYMCIFYATINAFWDAIGYAPEDRPSLDLKTGVFHFSKGRSI